MKKYHQKTVFLFSTLLSIVLTSSAVYFGKSALEQAPENRDSQAIAAFSSQKSASISPIVLDGITEAPISGAVICIPETEKTYQTDENGSAGIISVPVIRDERFDEILPKDWGEITLLVYKEGYAPYGLFYLRICEEQARNGPTIYLYPKDSFSLGTPFTIIENPEDTWARELLKKYQPSPGD